MRSTTFFSLLIVFFIGASALPIDEERGNSTDTPEVFVQKFLKRATRVLNDHDFSLVCALFDHGFEFNKCDRKLDYYEVTLTLANCDPQVQISFELQTVEFRKMPNFRDDKIKFVVLIHGLGKELENGVELVLGTYFQQLLSGKARKCNEKANFARNDIKDLP
ncbi:Protein CBG27419 [Caenorhabditis briggsae]|nr:Protein CBG27419 [Caenorhabditis briggsae]CAS00226.1 Protein CBG27419 [Caenorhabditis briggsae]